MTTAPVFSVIKDGKEDLTVASVEFYMQRQDSNPSVTTKFACEAFNITGDCKQVKKYNFISAFGADVIKKFQSRAITLSTLK